MSSRINQEREQTLQPIRLEKALNKIRETGCDVIEVDNTKIVFLFKGAQCNFFAYSGWCSGKSITDCRGIDNLIKQLKLIDK